ncbi:NAD(P)/FAD-dependent oxidoreductase [Archaeoglobus neptunius]|uniref:NAD(P)/FAD-dependent oxidoreductase n=1 Tax=Archaeoglobus neptunius TaxID=2798580 RepID=UPI001928FDC3
MYDVAIVGAGVTGCFIAKELSKYNLRVVVFERKAAPGLGQTKGCSGIIHAFQLPFNSLKGKLCLEGNAMMDREAEELGFSFKRVGLILVATNPITKLILPLLRAYFSRYVEVRQLDRDEILQMEPNLTDGIRGGLFFPSAGVVNPVEMTYAAYRFAKANGVEFRFNCGIKGIKRRTKSFILKTEHDDLEEAKFVINCAGLHADEISRMAGYDMTITPGKGSHIVFNDKGFAHHLIAEIPLKPDRRTKGGGALVSIDGKPVWGPNLIDTSDKEDTAVRKEEVDGLKRKFGKLFRKMPEDVIAYYAGVRSIAGKDFVINQPIRNFINVAGIQSPGLTAAPAIAKKIVKMLVTSGIEMKKKKRLVKPKFIRLKDLNLSTIEEIVRTNPDYGDVICLCELVSKAEILNVAKEFSSFDAVRHITRAGMSCNKCHADIIVLMQRVCNKVVKDSAGSEVIW